MQNGQVVTHGIYSNDMHQPRLTLVVPVRPVQAAADIQRNAASHDDLGIKVGLSAGEPVSESDDIYGAAVNLAARICAHASGGQSLAASTVRDLSIGKHTEFAEQGTIALKGFPEPVRLFEIIWK